MPQLIVKGLTREALRALSLTLPEELSRISDTPLDYFTLELSENIAFSQGKEATLYPLVEVKQFDRGLLVERKMARAIQKAIRAEGYDEVEVYFIHLDRERYFE